MGYVFNNNQPIVFDYDNGFCGTVQREYCILKNSTDRISAQFKLAAGTVNQTINPTFTPSAEIMSNPEFTGSATGWTLTGGWGYSSNTVGTLTAGTVSQAVTNIQAGKTYFVEMEINPTAYGAAPSFTFSIGGVTAATDLGTLAVSSTYYLKGYFTVTNTNNLIITNNNDWRGNISKVSVKEVGWTVLTNNDFNWVNTTEPTVDWEVSTNACHTQGNSSSLIIQFDGYTYSLTIGDTYKVVLTATSITEGEINVYLGATLLGTIEKNGTYVYTGTLTNALLDVLYIAPTSNFDGCVDNCYAYVIPDNFAVGIFDTDDNYVMALPTTEVSQSGEWIYFETTAAELGLDPGCYRFKLTETSTSEVRTQYVTNGDFSGGAANWTYTSGWAFNSINATGTSTNSTDIETLNQTIQLETCDQNRELTLTFDIVIDSDSSLDLSVQGLNSGTPFATQSYGTTGSKTITFIPTDDTQVEIIFDFACVNPAVNKTVQIDNVSVFSSGCDLTYVYESNCMNVATSHDCTKNFEWYNEKNSFGFNYVDFTTIFDLRIHCDFGKWSHKQNWNIWKNYNMNSSVVAGDSTEMFEIKTEMLPENVHRALAVARMHEFLYIDTVRTFADATDYEPEWNEKNKNFAIVRFDVWQQALRTNACGVDITPPADEEVLLDPNTGECILSLE